MIKAPDRIMHHVRDMARAQALYRDVLGLKPKEEHAQFSGWAITHGRPILEVRGALLSPSLVRADADGLSDKSGKNFWKGFGEPSL
jgi:hypothetical protein